MGHPHQLQTAPTMTFGQKASNVAHTMKNIFEIGSGIYHVAKSAAPIIRALL